MPRRTVAPRAAAPSRTRTRNTKAARRRPSCLWVVSGASAACPAVDRVAGRLDEALVRRAVVGTHELLFRRGAGGDHQGDECCEDEDGNEVFHGGLLLCGG